MSRCQRWRTLLQLDGPPSRRTLFFLWIRRDGTMLPLLMPVDGVPVEPDRVALDDLAAAHATVAETEDADPGDLHLAMLLERHGPAGLDCSLHVGNGRTAVPVLPRRSWPVG